MIEVTGLRKSFGEVEAVRSVSFSAPDGQITGLLGPNGAGKTTSLRMLYTLLTPDAGEIRVDNFSPAIQPLDVQSRIGVLPDNRGLYKHLTAVENIRYFGELHGLAGKQLEQRIDLLVKVLDIGEFADRRTDGFSQGQRVKTAIARALIHDPQNLMLDEPTNGLDVMSTRSMRSFLRELRDQGKCVLFSSHIMQEVAALCDTIVIIDKGEVKAHGTAHELREQTGCEDLEDAFVAVISDGQADSAAGGQA